MLKEQNRKLGQKTERKMSLSEETKELLASSFRNTKNLEEKFILTQERSFKRWKEDGTFSPEVACSWCRFTSRLNTTNKPDCLFCFFASKAGACFRLDSLWQQFSISETYEEKKTLVLKIREVLNKFNF